MAPLDLGQVPLVGSEVPRIWTPPLRPLWHPDGSPDTNATWGHAACTFADEVLGVDLDPWQQWLLIHALEVRQDGTFRFRNVVVLVGRQNGKTTLAQVLSLFYLFVLGARLILGTAQDLDTATETWQGALDLANSVDELADLMDKPIMVNGNKTIRLKSAQDSGGQTNGERYKVKAANRRAGRGLSSDLIILDELREHQTWDAWAAVTGTTNARPNAQIWALSNAGDATSVVLRYLRKTAHRALGDPDGINAADLPGQVALAPDEDMEVDEDDTLGIFEWSAPPGCHTKDRAGWAMANPSLGHGRVTERTLASKSNEPEWVWRTEGLCQWSDGTLVGPFPAGSWDACRDRDSRPREGSPIGLCLDVSWDRSTTHIALGAIREDGLVHVEVIASAAGTEWAHGWLTSQDRDPRIRRAVEDVGVLIQAAGAPASTLIEGLRAIVYEDDGTTVRHPAVKVVEWKGTDLGKATGGLYDLVRDHGLRHRGQPLLDVAAATAVTRPNTDAYVWDRKGSPTDAAPLVAITGAVAFVTGEAAAAYDVLASVF